MYYRFVFLSFVLVILSLNFAQAAGNYKKPAQKDWSFNGIFGMYDPASLQRGYQVYDQVCAACHAMDHLYYRDLAKIGYSEAEVKAIAASKLILDEPDDRGEILERPGLPSDRFKKPFANDQQASFMNNGKVPPDMSLIVHGRHYGANYIHALLTGYQDPPSDISLPEGVYYNPYYPGKQIGMAPPLVIDGQVDYADGTDPSVYQMSKDVTHFLQWASDPHMETRKRTGLASCLFLLVFSGLMYGVKKKLWSDLH